MLRFKRQFPPDPIFMISGNVYTAIRTLPSRAISRRCWGSAQEKRRVGQAETVTKFR